MGPPNSMLQTSDLTPQESTILDVIKRETDAFLREDFESWAACWVHSERTREVCISSSFGATVLEGWERLASYMRNVIESGSVCKISRVQRSNIVITTSGDLAHVVFDEYSENEKGRIETTFETRVLECVEGTWRILYASFVLRGHQYVDENRLAINAKGEILCPPAQAQELLLKHPVLRLSHNRLRASKPAWDKILRAGLDCAAEQHGYFQHYKYMTESGRNFRLPIVFGETDEGGVAVCILFVRDGVTFVETQNDGDLEERLNVAKTIYGLSKGQMLLAHRIVSGDTLTAASDTLGISINTARTHLSRVYVKTGVNSQTALVRTLLSVG